MIMKILFILVLFISLSTPLFAKYQRADWEHWIDEDQNCLNTRAELLKARSKTQVTMRKKGCTVDRGEWEDYYTGRIHTVASFVEVDHIVPIYEAHKSGGKDWTASKKKEFANDLENLAITAKKLNRNKSAKIITQFKADSPERNKRYICTYFKIKSKYSLKFTEKEMTLIKAQTCPSN